MENISELIRKARPEIRNSTLAEYVAKIRSAYRKVTGDTSEPKNLDFLQYPDQVKDILEEKWSRNTVKAAYNAFVVALQAAKQDALAAEYGGKRDVLHKQYEEQAKSGEMTERQKRQMVSMDRIDRLLERLKEDADEIYTEADGEIDRRDMNFLQDYLTLLVHRHIPLRNELAHVEIVTDREYRGIPQKKRDLQNYLVVKKRGRGKAQKRSYELRLNNYKTSKTYGERVIPVPKEVETEMTRYLLYNRDPFLMLNKSRTGPMSSQQFSNRFSRFMERYMRGKRIASNVMRHIYVSDKYSGVIENMKRDAELMGHDVETQKLYIKSK